MTIGFIGAGNMGGALATAAAKAVGGECLLIADVSAEKAAALAAEIGAVDIPDGFGIGDIFDGEKWQHCKVEENVDPQADTDAMLVDHEMRLTMLELGI